MPFHVLAAALVCGRCDAAPPNPAALSQIPVYPGIQPPVCGRRVREGHHTKGALLLGKMQLGHGAPGLQVLCLGLRRACPCLGGPSPGPAVDGGRGVQVGRT